MNTTIYKILKAPVIITGALFFFCCKSNLIFGQGTTGMVENDFQRTIHFFDNSGKTFVNPNLDVAGTPFLNEDWRLGRLKVGDNTIFNNIKIRLNLYSQEVHFLKSDNVEMSSPKGTIKEIVVFDSINNKALANRTFLCGFPSIDNQNEKNFYELICNGKIKLLESMRKTIHQDTDDLSGTVQKEFREYDDYYFLIQGESALQRIKRDKDFVLNFMKDRKDKVAAFLQTTKISFKSTDDIKNLVDYYNSL